MWWMISQKSQQKMSKPSSKSNFFPLNGNQMVDVIWKRGML